MKLKPLVVLALLLVAGGCRRVPAQRSSRPVTATVATPAAISTPAPRPLARVQRTSLPLSGEWRFAVDRYLVGEDRRWFAEELDDAGWDAVTVPHTWNIMAGNRDYAGVAWYRRRFVVPAEMEGAHLRLHFEAVFYLARVWLNGTYLGEHEGGYTPFELDVTGAARLGMENLLAVQVDNKRSTSRIPAAFPNGGSFDWWNYGGIVRGVSLEASSRAYIAQQRIVAVPDLAGVDQADAATITATVTISNTSTQPFDGLLSADILDEAGGRSVLPSPLSVAASVAPGKSAHVTLTARVKSPKLWHFDHPNLYRWSASLVAGGEMWDQDDEVFGVRLIELKEARLYLNGEPVRLVGLTRHADSPQAGLAETATIMAADYADLKRLNMVLSRPVHYPQAEFILDYADRHGILLIPEVPAWQLTAAQMADAHTREVEKQQLREMIATQANHPSVWAWSVGNEIESDTESGRRFVRDMIAWVKSLDPTRPVGFASNRLGGNPLADATAYADLVLMNQYFGTWAGPKSALGPALDAIHRAWPDKPVIISEYGFEPHWNRWWKPSAVLDPAEYYLIPDDVPSEAEEADARRRQVIAEQLPVFRSRSFVVGAIFWTYQDYRTPTGFKMGVVDAERRQRGSWALLRREHAPALIDTVAFGPAEGARQEVGVTLHARGPVDVDMPAYTLRGYRLRWSIRSPTGGAEIESGELLLPTLVPGASWSGKVDWPVPDVDYVVELSIMRPTGFAVSELRYDSRGVLLP